jgi:arabinose-5-phosphate isomerase
MLETLKQKSAGVTPAILIDGPAINEALKTVLCKETDALVLCIQHFPENACTVVDDIVNTTGKIIISGMGKSGLIGKKIVATF